jgi:hypothetical protein
MGGERKDLAGHAKGADSQLMTALNGRSQGAGIVVCYLAEIGPPACPIQRCDIAVSGGAEPDRRVEELAAESPT